MREKGRHGPPLRTVLLGLVIALLTSAAATAATLHPTLLAKAGYGPQPVGFARTPDGSLHVALESSVQWGDSFNGVGAIAISPSGQAQPEVQALSWNGPSPGSPNGVPGLAVLPSGALQAVFGGSPGGDPGPWGISSTNNGASWTTPVDVGSGSMEAGDSNVALAVSNGTPVIAAGCCGGIVIQKGFGTGAPTFLLTNSSDGAAGNTDLAVDGSSGAAVASWDSNAGAGGAWLQQAAPSVGAAQQAPIPSQYGTGTPLILAGRDSGPGVFAAYPSNFANTTKISLLQYGGGSISVGSVKGLHANTWGAATGGDGRIWVMWAGQLNGKGVIAVTRSNQTLTKFEPPQTYSFEWSSLFTLSGDGRLGPLDMLMSGTPNSPLVNGIYYARILPGLAAKVSVKRKGHKFTLKVKVTDAGAPVSGAKVKAKGAHKKTKSSGSVKLKVRGKRGKRITITIKHSGYAVLKKKVKL